MFGWTLVRTKRWKALRQELTAANAVRAAQRGTILGFLHTISVQETEIRKAKER